MIQHITEVREFAGDDTEIKSLVDEGSFGEGQGSSMPPSAVNSVLEQINLVLLNFATSCVLLGYLNSTQFFGFQGTFCASMESGSGRDYAGSQLYRKILDRLGFNFTEAMVRAFSQLECSAINF